jgi:hypothetical protein
MAADAHREVSLAGAGGGLLRLSRAAKGGEREGEAGADEHVIDHGVGETARL